MLHLLSSGCGTEPLRAHVRIHGEYWRVSGLTAELLPQDCCASWRGLLPLLQRSRLRRLFITPESKFYSITRHFGLRRSMALLKKDGAPADKAASRLVRTGAGSQHKPSEFADDTAPIPLAHENKFRSRA